MARGEGVGAMNDEPPLVEIAVEPKSKSDQEKMGVAATRNRAHSKVS